MDTSFFDFLDVLESSGWSFTDEDEFHARGKSGIKFHVEPDSNESSKFSELLTSLEESLPDFSVLGYTGGGIFNNNHIFYSVMILNK